MAAKLMAEVVLRREAEREAARRVEIAAMFRRVRPAAYLAREKWDWRNGYGYEMPVAAAEVRR